MMTPYDKLKPLPDVEQYLKPEITLETLDGFAVIGRQNRLTGRSCYQRIDAIWILYYHYLMNEAKQ